MFFGWWYMVVLDRRVIMGSNNVVGIPVEEQTIKPTEGDEACQKPHNHSEHRRHDLRHSPCERQVERRREGPNRGLHPLLLLRWAVGTQFLEIPQANEEHRQVRIDEHREGQRRGIVARPVGWVQEVDRQEDESDDGEHVDSAAGNLRWWCWLVWEIMVLRLVCWNW